MMVLTTSPDAQLAAATFLGLLACFFLGLAAVALVGGTIIHGLGLEELAYRDCREQFDADDGREGELDDAE